MTLKLFLIPCQQEQKFLSISLNYNNMQTRIKTLLNWAFLKIIPGLLAIYFFIFTGFYIYSLRSTLAEWNSKEINKPDAISYSSEEWNLVHEKAFLNARLAMSVSDSIGLTLNLKDSLVQLEMKGVVLRQVKADKIELPRFLKAIKTPAYAIHFSKPFIITEIEGSIEKNPVFVRKVPKDTIEAALTQVAVDTSKIGFIEWHLLLDNSLVVSLVQSDQFEGRFDLSTLKYRLRRHIKTLRSTNRDVLKAKKPQILPEITVFIPANEAKSFFRALPPNGQVVVRL
jgi:hypothetical protein